MYKRIAACLMAVILMAMALTGCDMMFTSPGESAPPSAEQTESTPPEQETPHLPVVLYLPNDNADGFKTKAAQTDGTVEHIISLLVEEKALPEGCALISFAKDDRGGEADMNAAYLQAISEGTTAEYIRLGCVVNTLLSYFELDEITLTIEGKRPKPDMRCMTTPCAFTQIRSLISVTRLAAIIPLYERRIMMCR